MTSNQKRNILHVGYSQIGGAGSVAFQLADAQSQLENYKSMYLSASLGSVRTKPFENIPLTGRSIIDQYLVKKRDWPTLVSFFRNIHNSEIGKIILNHEGIIHLHWLNGVIQIEKLVNYVTIGKKVVWTIHDMEPFTGGCHYALDCKNFEKFCANCPAVHSAFKSKISNNKIQKNKIFSQLGKIYFVFPTEYLLNSFKLANSAANLNTQVIQNPVPKIFFQKSDRIKDNSDSLTIGFVCRDLNDPIKQFKSVINALEELSFLTTKSLKLIAVGSKFRDFPKRLNFEVFQPGVILNPLKMHELYSKMDLLVSNSLAESFGLTIAEAAACGVPSLVLEGSGSRELILNNRTGILFKDCSDLIKQLLILCENNSLRVMLGTNAKLHSTSEWHIDNVTQEYDKLYERIS